MGTSDVQLYFAAVRSDFKVFLRQAFVTLYPGKQFFDGWHIDAIVHVLEESRAGRRPRQIINLPPRHLKSFIVSVAWPAFLIGHDPTVKIMCVSYSDELTKTLARDFKRIVDSAWYPKLFPEVKLTKSTESELVTSQGGFRLAVSVGGSLTGRGGDFILIDDPIKPEDAQSDKTRNSVNEWLRSTLLSRLDDKAYSTLTLVMQRVHVNDLTGFTQGSGGFQRLSLPAIATEDQTIPLRDGGIHKRRRGDVLQPLLEDKETLAHIKSDIGSVNFSAQYQQAPEIPEGSMFRRKWIQLVTQAPKIDLNRGQLILSIDSAASTSEWADYSAMCLVYVQNGKFYVLEADRGRWEYETLKVKVLAYAQRFGPELQFIVEHASTGISLYQFLLSRKLRCQYYLAKSAKETRACYVVPTFEQLKVHFVNIPGGNAWVDPLINELMSFPNGRFDDQVDSLVQVIMLRRCHMPAVAA
jgi:predicted phage terminase large subunit-like protein